MHGVPDGDAPSNAMKLMIAILSVVVWSMSARAQTNDSLDAFLETALANNPEIATAHKKWDAALAEGPAGTRVG